MLFFSRRRPDHDALLRRIAALEEIVRANVNVHNANAKTMNENIAWLLNKSTKQAEMIDALMRKTYGGKGKVVQLFAVKNDDGPDAA